MRKIRLSNPQTAQGMVEFALVLPVLLLLILGVFAFGHLFFVYSSVVSASREAARWGAAAGEAPSTFPRFRDCASIRASAVRVGAFAGVNASELIAGNPNDPGVGITYDHGPVETGDPIQFDSCPEGDIGPETVEMGDRIVVTVRVDYTPIVPFINIPSFPLEATTARTIMINVPVGDAPIAEDPCISETIIDIVPDPEPSFVGQNVSYDVTVLAPDSYDPEVAPSGQLRLVDSPDGHEWLVDLNPDSGTATINYTYTTAGIRQLTAEYIPDNSCFLQSFVTPLDNMNHEVRQAPTEMLFTLSPGTPVQRGVLTVTVNVRAVAPGVGTPTGPVTLSFTQSGQAAQSDTRTLTDGVAVFTFIPQGYTTGTISGVYAEDASPDFTSTTRVMSVNVLRAGTATPTSPAVTNTPVMIGTPTRTAVPEWCPRATGAIDFSVPSGLQFDVANNGNGAQNVVVDSIEMIWPSLPNANWQEVRFGSNVSACTRTGNNRNCPWRNSDGVSPTHQTITSTNRDWVQQAAGLNINATKTLRLVFNGTLPTGNFWVRVHFNNNCVIEIDRTRQ